MTAVYHRRVALQWAATEPGGRTLCLAGGDGVGYVKGLSFHHQGSFLSLLKHLFIFTRRSEIENLLPRYPLRSSDPDVCVGSTDPSPSASVICVCGLLLFLSLVRWAQAYGRYDGIEKVVEKSS